MLKQIMGICNEDKLAGYSSKIVALENKVQYYRKKAEHYDGMSKKELRRLQFGSRPYFLLSSEQKHTLRVARIHENRAKRFTKLAEKYLQEQVRLQTELFGERSI